MKNLFSVFVIFVFSSLVVFAQNQQPPCTSAAYQQFDFWLGEWNLEWTDSQGKKLTGTNTIKKILNGCVIEENFSAGSFFGKSHSMFDGKSGKWKQTWVDNGAEYLDLTGEFKDGKMTLIRSFTNKEGKSILQRMIFSNIQKDSLEWDWQRSDDNGQTWKTNWKVFYKRKSAFSQPFDIKQVRTFIEEANKGYGKRFTTNDLSFYSEKYTSDACIMPENSPEICGRDNIRNYYYANGQNNKLKIFVSVREISGNEEIVVEVGAYEVFDENNKSLNKGKFITTWKTENNVWKLHREIWNSNFPVN